MKIKHSAQIANSIKLGRLYYFAHPKLSRDLSYDPNNNIDLTQYPYKIIKSVFARNSSRTRFYCLYTRYFIVACARGLYAECVREQRYLAYNFTTRPTTCKSKFRISAKNTSTIE